MSTPRTGAVFAQTNDAAANAVVAFARAEDGTLSRTDSYPTGGLGNGVPHLPSQGSVVLAAGGTRLLVANAGSNDVSVFALSGDGLALVDRTPSGGTTPRSIAAHGDLVYVLNAGGDGPGAISGFRQQQNGQLEPIAGSERRLSSEDADGAQVAFDPSGRTLVITERGTDRISTYTVREDGSLDGPTARPSSGATPYGFDFTADGVLVVTEAFGGQVGAAAASSYRVNGTSGAEPVSASVGNTRSEVCWAVVGKDGRHAYVTNFGDGTISSYSISPPNASVTITVPSAVKSNPYGVAPADAIVLGPSA